MEEKTIGSFPRTFYTISLSAFLFELASYVTQPIFTLYLLGFNISILEIGFLLSIQSFLMIVLRVPLTIVAQRIGEIKMMYIIFIVLSTTQVLYAFAPSQAWLYIMPFYQVIATGSFFQLATSLISNMAPPSKQGDALGRYMAFLSLGMFIGPILCSALVAFLDYRQLFLVSALFPAAGMVLLPHHTARKAPAQLPSAQDQPVNGSNNLGSLKSIFGQRNVIILSIIRALYAMSNRLFSALFAIYAVQQLTLTPSVIALLFSAIGFSNMVIKLPAGVISDRLGRKKVLSVTFGIIVLDYIALAYVKDIIPLGIAVTAFGACWGIRAVTEWSFLSSTIPPETKTMMISYMESFWDIGATAGNFLAGAFTEIFPFSTIFLIAALINIPALPAIHAMKQQLNH